MGWGGPRSDREQALADIELLAAEIRVRTAALRAAGATEAEIVRDLRGDASVGRQYGLAGER